MILLGFIGSQELIVLLIIGLLFSILPILALIDILSHDFKENNKLIWVLVVLFTWMLGALLYFFIGRKQKVI